MATVTQQLFDKIINVDFYSDVQGSVLQTSIKTPDEGRKPAIRITGQLTAQMLITTIKVKVTNLYTSQDVSSFKLVKITAGYKNNAQLAFNGQIINAYVETPPPDKVTVFEVNIGNIEDLYTKWVNTSYPKNTTLTKMLNDLSSFLNIRAVSNFNEIVFPAGINFNGTIRDAFAKICRQNPQLRIKPELDAVYVFDITKGNALIKNIDFITSAKKDASGFSINAPWLPTVRPGDVVQLNPAYYTQEFGGANVIQKTFNVVTVDFDFSTVENVNNMLLRCVI